MKLLGVAALATAALSTPQAANADAVSDFYQSKALKVVIGSRMGTAVSQSVMGDRIGHVTDVSGKDPNERAYRNSLELPLHTDISDIVGMLCIRPAMRGGESLRVGKRCQGLYEDPPLDSDSLWYLHQISVASSPPNVASWGHCRVERLA